MPVHETPVRRAIRGAVERIVRRLRGREYPIDPAVRTLDLTAVLLNRTVEAIRGAVRLQRPIPVFLGRKVELAGRAHLFVSDSVVIERYARVDARGGEAIHIGGGVTIGAYSDLRVTGVLRSIGGYIRIGAGSSVGMMSTLWGQGGIEIGRGTITGPRLSIFSADHRFDDAELPIRDQGEVRAPVRIGDGCWVGANVTILRGTTIGDRSVIAAGSVVRGSFPSNALIGGVPARVIRPLHS